MDLSEVFRSFRELWDYKPWTIILAGLGFVGSLVLVVDTWRHRRKRKRPR
jgi:hypothetical protein